MYSDQILNKYIKHPPICPKTFIVDDKQFTGPNIVDIFNKFFTNIGSDLTKSVPIQHTNVNDFHIEPTVSSMFMREITENDVHEIVSQFHSKTSTHYSNFRMTFAK